jgi:hypothetical protein
LARFRAHAGGGYCIVHILACGMLRLSYAQQGTARTGPSERPRARQQSAQHRQGLLRSAVGQAVGGRLAVASKVAIYSEHLLELETPRIPPMRDLSGPSI